MRDPAPAAAAPAAADGQCYRAGQPGGGAQQLRRSRAAPGAAAPLSRRPAHRAAVAGSAAAGLRALHLPSTAAHAQHGALRGCNRSSFVPRCDQFALRSLAAFLQEKGGTFVLMLTEPDA